MAEAVGRWHKHGLLHRDLSVSNVGLAPDGTALIWDFPTMATVSEAAEDPGRLIGDPLYMGYDVQMGEPPTLSSELESISFILLHLSSEDGVLPWQDEPSPADRDIKWSLMTVHEKVFRTKVRMVAIMSPSFTLHAMLECIRCAQANRGSLKELKFDDSCTQVGPILYPEPTFRKAAAAR